MQHREALPTYRALTAVLAQVPALRGGWLARADPGDTRTRRGEFGEPRPGPHLLSCALSRCESVTVSDLVAPFARRTLPPLSADVGVCAIKMLAAPIRCVPPVGSRAWRLG